MTREDVIREIVGRDLQKLALTAEAVLRESPGLHTAACDHFGTWDTALRYAGIHVRRGLRKLEYSPDRVLRELRVLSCGGYNLLAAHNLRRDRRLYEAARRHFGGWKRALRAAGLNLQQAGLRRKPQRLDKQQIIDALRQRNAAGLSLRWSCICLENRTLAKSARHAFCTWRRALEAAGIPLPPGRAVVYRKWDAEIVIQRIHDRRREGQPLTYERTRLDDSALVAAARRYFGNWRAALKAAGIEPE